MTDIDRILKKVPNKLKPVFENAVAVYCNPGMKSMDEFKFDFFRYRLVRKLIRRYKTSGCLRARLILNHIICLSNVFGSELTVKLLFSSIEPQYHPSLKTFLVYLEYIQTDRDYEVKAGINTIPLDQYIIVELRNPTPDEGEDDDTE